MTLHFRTRVKFRVAVSVLILFLLAAGGCGSARVVPKSAGVDENLIRLNRSARIAYDNGQLEQAANLYRQALDRAYLRDDRQAVVDAQYNLAVCMLGLRSYDNALERVHQARNELVRGEQSITADILLLEAAILFRTGKPDKAWQITDQILSASERTPGAVESKTHFLRGLIADQRGDTGQLGREIDALTKSDNPGRQAEREELTGRLARAEGNWEAAIKAFDLTVRLQRENLNYGEMSRALALAADACQRAGKPSEAAKRYFWAGRSAVQQGNNQDAIKWLNSAARIAGQAGDEPLKEEAHSYLESIPSP
ncbi:tetratricopeptide repeat protein [Thermodesulfobacteriota bacterium]